MAILQCYIKISVVAAPFDQGTLFVVATPIGNLEDITLRALRVLREVDVVAAEDTRRTGNLLRHFEIGTPLLSLHEHNEIVRVPKILERLRAGKSVALVSDAGTPAISDPGAAVVRAVRDAGFRVVPIPGASAVAAAVSAAGLAEGRFAFGEFPPVRSKARKQWLGWVADQRAVNVVFFEAPHRILKTLGELRPLLGNRPIMVGREMTKIHEEWKWGTVDELSEYFSDPQGEFVLVIPADPASDTPGPVPSDHEVFEIFGRITEMGDLGRREAVRKAADALGIPAKAVYEAIERVRKLGE